MSIRTAQEIGQGSADALLEALQALQGRIALRLAALAARLDTDASGRIRNTAANIGIVETIIADAKATMIDEEFIAALALYLQSFDAITNEVIDEFDEDLDEDALRATDRLFKGTMAEALTNPDTYGSSLWRPLANSLVLGVVSESLLGDTVSNITEQVTAAPVVQAIEGDVATATSTLGRTITQGIADQIGAEFFLYQGRPIRTTRAFCREREGRVWHRREIEEWGRKAAAGEDLDGNGNPGWAGMVEGTNAQTIFLYLGGWYGGREGCRHVLIPQSRLAVPQEDLDRMRELGYIE
jgi:hypothetical protein